MDRLRFVSSRAACACQCRDQATSVGATRFQSKRDVLRDGEVRVERVVLKDKRNVAIFRGNIVHECAVDFKRAFRDLFEPSDHAQRRALSTARWPNKNTEFAVFDREIDGIDSAETRAAIACVDLANFGERHIRHRGYLNLSPRHARDLRRRSSALR